MRGRLFGECGGREIGLCVGTGDGAHVRFGSRWAKTGGSKKSGRLLTADSTRSLLVTSTIPATEADLTFSNELIP
jgi:hypothetical protein